MNARQMPEPESADFTAQFAEDRLLAEYFGDKAHGFFVEVGAYNGIDFSNSYYFERIGWQGILIEPDPDMAECCRQSRPNSKVVQCAVVNEDSPPEVSFDVIDGWKALSSLSFTPQLGSNSLPPELIARKITVAAKTLDQILTDCKVDTIDFITIDVEGQEWGVLQGFTIDRWRPQIVIIERHTARPERKILDYMHQGHYQYIRTTGGINDWFYRDERPPALFYHLRIFGGLTLPGLFVELVVHPIKNAARSALSKFGMLDCIRLLVGRCRSKS